MPLRIWWCKRGRQGRRVSEQPTWLSMSGYFQSIFSSFFRFSESSMLSLEFGTSCLGFHQTIMSNCDSSSRESLLHALTLRLETFIYFSSEGRIIVIYKVQRICYSWLGLGGETWREKYEQHNIATRIWSNLNARDILVNSILLLIFAVEVYKQQKEYEKC